jgi:hypothetical protein
MTTCPLCSKQFKQLHGSHLKIHNITTKQLKDQFPNISFRNPASYKTQTEKSKQQTIEDNIRCLHCNSLITGRTRKTKRFCNSSCAASFNNTKREKYSKTCKRCGISFKSSCKHSKFCSQRCSTLNKTKERVEVICNNCSNAFLKSKRLVQRSDKHFCINECKKQYYKINSHERGIYNKHNGRSVISTYRKLAFANYKHECYYCNYNKFIDVLQVHHLDENRHNNSLENLRIVCPTCHSEVHKNYK